MNPTAWAKSNPKAAAGVGGVVGVGLLAYLKKRKAAAAPAPATTDPSATTAGLSGIPNTLGTDIGNNVQDQLNQFQQDVNGQLGAIAAAGAAAAAPAPAKTPTPPPPAPSKHDPIPAKPKPAPTKPAGHAPVAPRRPATSYFTIPAGGSLYAAAQSIYGHATPANVGQLAALNGIKLYNRGGTTYADVHAGQRIQYTK